MEGEKRVIMRINDTLIPGTLPWKDTKRSAPNVVNFTACDGGRSNDVNEPLKRFDEAVVANLQQKISLEISEITRCMRETRSRMFSPGFPPTFPNRMELSAFLWRNPSFHEKIVRPCNDSSNSATELRYLYLRKEDIGTAFDIERQSYPKDEAATLEGLQLRQSKANEFFIGTYLRNSLVGFVCGTLTNSKELEEETMAQHDPHGSFLCIHSVVVLEKYRRRGYAREMLKHYIKTVLENPKIESILLISKVHLLQFYASCGFHVNKLSPIIHGKDPWIEMGLECAQARQLAISKVRLWNGESVNVVIDPMDFRSFRDVLSSFYARNSSYKRRESAGTCVVIADDHVANHFHVKSHVRSHIGQNDALFAVATVLRQTKRVNSNANISFIDSSGMVVHFSSGENDSEVFCLSLAETEKEKEAWSELPRCENAPVFLYDKEIGDQNLTRRTEEVENAVCMLGIQELVEAVMIDELYNILHLSRGLFPPPMAVLASTSSHRYLFTTDTRNSSQVCCQVFEYDGTEVLGTVQSLQALFRYWNTHRNKRSLTVQHMSTSILATIEVKGETLCISAPCTTELLDGKMHVFTT